MHKRELTYLTRSNDPQVLMMRRLFLPASTQPPKPAQPASESDKWTDSNEVQDAPFAGQLPYPSDESDSSGCESKVEIVQPSDTELVTSYRAQRRIDKKRRNEQMGRALEEMQKKLTLKTMSIEAGIQGLQARHMRAIESLLQLVLKNNRLFINASEHAAEVQGFAAKHGGQMVRSWTRDWVRNRALPSSRRGRHVKMYSILSDPRIAVELRGFLRSKKWAIDPKKLTAFTEQKLLPDAAKEYLEHIIDEEMPACLQKYLQVELFPHIHFKVGKVCHSVPHVVGSLVPRTFTCLIELPDGSGPGSKFRKKAWGNRRVL